MKLSDDLKEYKYCKANYMIMEDWIEKAEKLEGRQNRLIIMLIKEGYLLSNRILPTTKPNHGSCCCCQDCGHHYDDCVCEHNNLLSKILELEE